MSECREMRSLTRPTVPTTTWPPARSCACWLRMGAPPNTATTSMPLALPYARRAWVTFEQRGDGLLLDRARGVVAHGAHGGEDVIGQAEVGKRRHRSETIDAR